MRAMFLLAVSLLMGCASAPEPDWWSGDYDLRLVEGVPPEAEVAVDAARRAFRRDVGGDAANCYVASVTEIGPHYFIGFASPEPAVTVEDRTIIVGGDGLCGPSRVYLTTRTGRVLSWRYGR